MEERKILHLSDLHFGYRFNRGNWDEILTVITDQRPDLVVITGDLVNTPWFWTIKRAARAVRELEKKLREHPSTWAASQENASGPRVILVPGNHDTRISGLVDIRWLWCFSAALVCAAYWMFAQERTWQTQHLSFYILSGLALVCLLLRALTTSDLSGAFGEAYIKRAVPYAWLGLGIVPIDSSRSWAFGAQGKVSENLRSELRESLGAAGTQRALWIALVHHHPLPMPYDAKQESVMIMTNAGLLLKELANYNIPLVLHGHKHHQHLSRIVVEDSNRTEKCVSVLAAGTATEKKLAFPKPHSFNVLRITGHGTVDLTVFESDGVQGFTPKFHRSILTSDLLAAQRINSMETLTTARAERLVSLASVDEYGNCRVVREYSAFGNYSTADLAKFEHAVELSSASAVITDIFTDTENQDRVKCGSAHENGPLSQCDVSFDPPLRAGGKDKINFSVGYFAMNMCALNKWQFANMYAKNECLETMTYRLPCDISISNFHMHLRFPHGSRLPSDIKLETLVGDEWVPCIACTTTPIHAVPIIFAAIRAPLPGAAYRFVWPVERTRYPPTQERDDLCSALGDFPRLRPEKRMELFTQVLSLVAGLLKDGDPEENALDADNICLSLYAYDAEERTLYLAGTGSTHTAAAERTYKFGVGLPGMAMKTGQVMFYNKNIPYERGTGRPNASKHRRDSIDRDNDGQEVIAVPIYDDHDLSVRQDRYRFEGVPYGVLRLSVDGISAKLRLHETSGDSVHATFCAAASILISEYVKHHLVQWTGGYNVNRQ
jgi:3',5'-cyclic AMP phosphodiesterase CpdA